MPLPTPALATEIEGAFTRCRELDASLGERLEALSESIRSLSPLLAAAAERMVERLKQHDVGATAPRVGERFPPFLLPDEHGRLMSLDDFLGRGTVAIAFHRGAWCPFCRLNTRALAHAQTRIEALGGQIVAIVPDRQQFTADLKDDAKAGFPILTDLDNAYALSLNLSYWLGEETERLYRAIGCDVPSFQGNDAWMVPVPATFVVGANGLVRMRFIDPDFRKRAAIEDLISAFQITDQSR